MTSDRRSGRCCGRDELPLVGGDGEAQTLQYCASQSRTIGAAAQGSSPQGSSRRSAVRQRRFWGIPSVQPRTPAVLTPTSNDAPMTRCKSSMVASLSAGPLWRSGWQRWRATAP